MKRDFSIPKHCGAQCTISWAPIIGGALGALGSIFGGGGGRDDRREIEQRSEPRWSPEQRPYVFGSQAWQPQMPLLNPYSVNYAGGLMGGYNPAYGPQAPMGTLGILQSLGVLGAPAGRPPWYQDPSATPQFGGIYGLLGYGQGQPPPALMNSPFFGHGVMNPELLHGVPGSDLTGGGPGQPPQPAAQAGPGVPVPTGYYRRGRDGGREYVEPTPIQKDQFLRQFEGRNINDLSPAEQEAFWEYHRLHGGRIF